MKSNLKEKIRKKMPWLKKCKAFFVRLIKPKFFYLLCCHGKPISSVYGMDRGKPIDRHYIENFLDTNKSHVYGKCLEILNCDYTIRYGGKSVNVVDVLDIDLNNDRANIKGDLRKLTKIEDETYDCIILTQVLHFIDDYESAIAECHRILKTGGVLLVTLPSLSRIDCVAGLERDFWRFTEASARYIFEKFFKGSSLEVISWGNSFAGFAFWVGLSCEDVGVRKLSRTDKNFPCLISVKAIK